MASESGTARRTEQDSLSGLESRTTEGDSPVSEILTKNDLASSAAHANAVRKWGAHFPRLNTSNDR